MHLIFTYEKNILELKLIERSLRKIKSTNALKVLVKIIYRCRFSNLAITVFLYDNEFRTRI